LPALAANGRRAKGALRHAGELLLLLALLLLPLLLLPLLAALLPLLLPPPLPPRPKDAEGSAARGGRSGWAPKRCNDRSRAKNSLWRGGGGVHM
jgi:hypothetical protein